MAVFDDLHISLGPPRLLPALVIGAHLLIAGALLAVTPAWLGYVSLPVVALSAWIDWQRVAAAPEQLHCVGGAGGQWTARFSPEVYAATLFDAPCATRWFTVLRLSEETVAAAKQSRRRTIVLGGDQLTETHARQLLRILRAARR